MRIILKPWTAKQLRFVEYPEYVRCAFYLNQSIGNIEMHTSSSAHAGDMVRIIEAAHMLGIKPEDVVIQEEL